jgi:hypothetical protein
MREAVYLLRFFHAVPPVSPMMTGTFAVVTLIGAVVVYTDPSRVAGALAPVLVLQLFAAASGFAVPARRGHYDLLLTRGVSRWLVALAHWASSSASGVISWLAIVAVELTATAGVSTATLASGTCAAVFLVSTLPWALTIALPRFSGGIGWLLALVMTTSVFSASVLDHRVVESTRIDALAWPAWAFLVYPIGLVGRRLSPAELIAIAPAIVLAVAAMVAACRWVARMDVPLEAAQ